MFCNVANDTPVFDEAEAKHEKGHIAFAEPIAFWGLSGLGNLICVCKWLYGSLNIKKQPLVIIKAEKMVKLLSLNLSHIEVPID